MHYNEVVLENAIKKATEKPKFVLSECSPLRAFVMFCLEHDMDGAISATEVIDEKEQFEALASIKPGGYILMSVQKNGETWEYELKEVFDRLPGRLSFLLTEREEEVEIEEDELEEIRGRINEKTGMVSCHACGENLGKAGNHYFSPKPKTEITNIDADVAYDQYEGERVFFFQVDMACGTCKTHNVYETHSIIE